MSDINLQSRYERTRDLKLREWCFEAYSLDPKVQSNAQIRLQLHTQLRLRHAEVNKYSQQLEAYESTFDTPSQADSKALECSADLKQARIATEILGAQARGDKKISVKLAVRLGKRWETNPRTLQWVLEVVELDRECDFGVFENVKDATSNVRIIEQVAHGKKNPVDEGADEVAISATQKHYEHSRDTLLRTWYSETKSKNAQKRINAQVCLQLQLFLRIYQATIQELNSKIRAPNPDEAEFGPQRGRLRGARCAVANLLESIRKQSKMKEHSVLKTMKTWEQVPHTLEEVLSERKYDKKSDFNIQELSFANASSHM